MLELVSRTDLRQWIENRKTSGASAALVPTMGNLHAGHLSLLDIASRHADLTVASIFVNPTQFGQGEDYSQYPRTLDADREKLIAAGCDVLFVPTADVLYPYGSEDFTRVSAPRALADILCGAQRPGHFDGVVSVVSRLFNLVQPQIGVFGEKDYQQLLIIRRMVADLGMPQQILAGPTVRDASGLAMSSRNQYLSTDARTQAAELNAALHRIGACLDDGDSNLEQLEQQAMTQLREAGFEPEYVSIRRADDLSRPTDNQPVTAPLRILAAARLNGTRLIDNISWPHT